MAKTSRHPMLINVDEGFTCLHSFSARQKRPNAKADVISFAIIKQGLLSLNRNK